jgi:YbgC/YbaW family acyl-CoA thioester hydrolase
MARIKVNLPENFFFTTVIPIRITDLNYGGHVGNDTILSLLHEARVQFLNHLQYTELNFAGVGLIMSDVAIEFKSELFYGDVIKAHVAAGDFSKIGFEIYYKMVNEKNEKVIATAKTGMVCYDYEKKKVVTVPEEAIRKLTGSSE